MRVILPVVPLGLVTDFGVSRQLKPNVEPGVVGMGRQFREATRGNGKSQGTERMRHFLSSEEAGKARHRGERRTNLVAFQCVCVHGVMDG